MLCYNKYRSEEHKLKMRVCWNRQTGTFEGRVFHDVWVQVPSLAPVLRNEVRYLSRLISVQIDYPLIKE